MEFDFLFHVFRQFNCIGSANLLHGNNDFLNKLVSRKQTPLIVFNKILRIPTPIVIGLVCLSGSGEVCAGDEIGSTLCIRQRYDFRGSHKIGTDHIIAVNICLGKQQAVIIVQRFFLTVVNYGHMDAVSQPVGILPFYYFTCVYSYHACSSCSASFTLPDWVLLLSFTPASCYYLNLCMLYLKSSQYTEENRLLFSSISDTD